MKKNKFLLLFVLAFLLTSQIHSQVEQSLIKEGAPKVYIDCTNCAINYIKEQIQIVNYVNDRKDADVHILFVSQRTGASGTEYSLFFIGQNQFNGLNDTIKFATDQTDSEDKVREKTVNALKLGLVKYIGKSKVADQVTISFAKPKLQAEKPKDDWDFWFFQASVSSNINGEEKYNYYYLNGSLSASRVTDDLKINLRLSNSYSENNFNYFDGTSDINIKSVSRNQNFKGAFYFSLDDHWSWGLNTSAFRSTYSNISFSGYFAAALEFNVFPYSQSNSRQLRINYQISPTFNKYFEETIFLKTSEGLVSQELSSTLSIIEPWGSTSLTLTGANYFHDMSKYELELYGTVSWKIVKGLSFSIYGGYSKIRNQISLPRGNASLEEVLLQRRQLETGYSYWGGLSISYSFGSIYNNIVNPRFGSSGGGGTTIIISN
ncbi:MAG: hypothetical protein GYA14_10040 [Ignavibacteria bacterium]|nr:hypothetical protein [Ignavibacteria bacterium]